MRKSAWVLGSLSPLEALRGMTDMSLRWSHASPFMGAARLLLLGLIIWGIIDLETAPGRGLILSAAGVLGLFALKQCRSDVVSRRD